MPEGKVRLGAVEATHLHPDRRRSSLGARSGFFGRTNYDVVARTGEPPHQS
jgi:hypothetical protein